MRRVRNHEDFLYHLKNARYKYEDKIRPYHLNKFVEFKEYFFAEGEDATAFEKDCDECLEIHLREYFINNLLVYLNWNVNYDNDGAINIKIEQKTKKPIIEGKYFRFMDYYGFEQKTELPLLIVETKPPTFTLPIRIIRKRQIDAKTALIDILREEEKNIEWIKLFEQLTKYVKASKDNTGSYPKRALITNGSWSILFLNPGSTLVERKCEVNEILICENPDEFNIMAPEIFMHLDYYHLTDYIPAIIPEEINYYGHKNGIDTAVRAMVVIINRIRTYPTDDVVIDFMPALCIRTKMNTWIPIQDRRRIVKLTCRLYKDCLKTICDASDKLLNDIETILGMRINIESLQEYFEKGEALKTFDWVESVNADRLGRYSEYRIITGQHPFFVTENSALPDCSLHKEGDETIREVPSELYDYVVRRIGDNTSSIFCYCKTNSIIKTTPINDLELKKKCGCIYTSEVPAVFCKVNKFEKHLCCKACVFEHICWDGLIFSLTC